MIIIGAGPCGLVALKELLAGGHDAIILERTSMLGGVFSSSAIYPNLHLTISNWAMAFSDFPDPKRLCYPTGEHYLEYLRAYARHFDLEQRIHYKSEVKSARLMDAGGWKLEVSEEDRPPVTYDADALIVATGANQIPKQLPSGLIGFTGRAIHSNKFDESFRQEVAEKKLRVLVVGGGESGADISADLGDLTPHTTVWLRRPACVGPRYLVKDPEMPQVKANQEADFPGNGFLEAATTNRMSAALNVYMYGFFRRLLWKAPILHHKLNEMCLASTAGAFVMNDQATYVTKNQRMYEAFGEGKIDLVVSPKIAAKGKTCMFTHKDGIQKQRDFDVVVNCTGFQASFPWLKIEHLNPNPRSWFLHCFSEQLGGRLFFVGYARPHQGGIPVMAEILSRYISLLLRGERLLPFNYAELAKQDGISEREHYHLSPHLSTLVDYNAFLESVARRVGCEPRLPAICILAFNLHMLSVLGSSSSFFITLAPTAMHHWFLLWVFTMAFFFLYQDALMIKWWFFPHWSAWYRQRGPGADAEKTQLLLKRVPFLKSTAVTSGFVLLVLWSVPTFYLQRILSFPVFVPYALLKAMGFRFPKSWGSLLRPKIFALHSVEWRFIDLFLP